MKLEDKKIAVIGVGGVGGYLAGMLMGAFPHVTLAARNGRGLAIREKGLVLHSEYKGERIVRPEKVVSSAEELEPQDYVFVCVKNYSLDEVCRQMKGALSEHTVVVPVMNGVDVGDRIRGFLDKEGLKATVVDSLIYIVSFALPDYSICQEGQFANLRIGIQNASEEEREKVMEVSRIFTLADIDHKAAEDIRREIWKKYILNCAYNVETACYDNTIGQLRDDPEKAALYEQLVLEACAVARAGGISIPEEYGSLVIHKFYHDYGDDATSSLQRDIREGRQSELDTFSGYLVREAERLGVPIPVSRRMYEVLKEKTCNF